MANFSTYDQVGRVEDVSGIISNIAPTKTPFQTLIGSENIHDIIHNWQEDTLDPPAANAQIEGANAPGAVMTPTLMRSNNTQIFSKTAATTGSTDKRKMYGRAKELAYQLGKKSAELKRDFEFALVGSHQSPVLGNNTSTARTFGNAWTMVDSSLLFNPDGTAFSGTTAIALTETALLNANQVLYAGGGEATTFMIKPADSLKVATWAAATGRTRYLEGGTKEIVNVVNVYVSPFGEQKVVLNRFIKGGQPGQTNGDAWLFDPSMWKKLTFRPWFRQTLAKTGDSTQVQILGEFSLKHRNFKASAAIGNLL
jgi:hypothetical protein